MQSLEKRVADLEAKCASIDHRIRMYFCGEGEDAAQARLKAGIAPDYNGRTICVQFLSSPNASKEQPNDND